MEGNTQRISDAAKAELQESGWLKEKLPNIDDRRAYMKWLEKNHKTGEPHDHYDPGSPEAEEKWKEWREGEGRNAEVGPKQAAREAAERGDAGPDENTEDTPESAEDTPETTDTAPESTETARSFDFITSLPSRKRKYAVVAVRYSARASFKEGEELICAGRDC